MNEDDMTQATNLKNKNTHDLNNLPNYFENKKEEYKSRLQVFTDLNLSLCNFMYTNLLEKKYFLSPIINVSLFNPRWKKFNNVSYRSLYNVNNEFNIINIR